jgi:hypothetical protein
LIISDTKREWRPLTNWNSVTASIMRRAGSDPS